MSESARQGLMQCGRKISGEEVEQIRETVELLPGLAVNELAAATCRYEAPQTPWPLEVPQFFAQSPVGSRVVCAFDPALGTLQARRLRLDDHRSGSPVDRTCISHRQAAKNPAMIRLKRLQ